MRTGFAQEGKTMNKFIQITVAASPDGEYPNELYALTDDGRIFKLIDSAKPAWDELDLPEEKLNPKDIKF